jgi:hypothetical protein
MLPLRRKRERSNDLWQLQMGRVADQGNRAVPMVGPGPEGVEGGALVRVFRGQGMQVLGNGPRGPGLR